MMKTFQKYSVVILACFMALGYMNVLNATNQSRHLQSFAELKSAIQEMKGLQTTQAHKSEGPANKCGLWISFEVDRLMPTLTKAEQDEIQALLAPQETQKSRVIGHFQFFYDTTGVFTPFMLHDNGDGSYTQIPDSYEQFVDSAGKYFNESWDMEINVLGYPVPPLNSSNLYPVYIVDYGDNGYYGVTEGTEVYAVDPLQREITKITIDNDFQYVYSATIGMPALKVTAAHEFHHALQLGDYGMRNGDQYFYEVTSVWMEDVVYPDVNDYYQYLSNYATRYSQFSRPELAFTTYNGQIEYSRIWGKFIEKRFSRDIMKRTWEFMRNYKSLSAIDHALSEVGSSFHQAFLEYSIWNMNTGAGCDTAHFYSEGKMYPTMRMKSVTEFNNVPRSIVDTVQDVAAVYYPICVKYSASDSCGQGRLMQVAIVNANMRGSTNWSGFTYLVNNQGGGSSFKKLNNGLYVKLSVPDIENWSTYESAPALFEDVQVYPNPIISNGQNQLSFRLPNAIQETAVLSVFSSSMDKIIAKELPVVALGYSVPSIPGVVWDCRTNNGEQVATGIYFFVVEIDGNQYQGKFAVVRE